MPFVEIAANRTSTRPHGRSLADAMVETRRLAMRALKLLALTTLTLAPLSAAQAPAMAESLQDSECPRERAEAARAAQAGGKADAPLFSRQAQSAALLP